MTFLRKRDVELMTMVLRFAGGSVFLWFGIDKWMRPEVWFGWVPAHFWPFSPFGAEWVVIAFGVFEFALGLLLVAGRFVRAAGIAAICVVAAVLAVTGIHEVAVRDAALMAIYFALVVEADRRAERKLPPNVLSVAGVVLVIALFLIGILYLRSS